MSELDRKCVEEYLDDIERGDAIAVIWTVNDVMDLYSYEHDEKEITLEQARDVLSNVKRRHDAEYGISWETIRFWLEEQINE